MQPPESLAVSLEAEMAVVGGMFIDPDAILRASDILDAEDFYREAHRILFRAMLDLADDGIPVDVVTLSEHLGRVRQLAAAGGAAYLAQLMDAVPTAANVEYHARIVREKAQLRRFAAIGADIVAMARAGQSADDVQEAAERLVFAAAQKAVVSTPLTSIKQVLRETMERLEGEDPGVRTGVADLDTLTHGLGRGDLVILAARPSMGKSSMGVQWAVNAAADGGGPVAFFSLEMSREALGARMLFSEARVDSNLFRKAPKEEHYARLSQAAAFLNGLPLYLHDRVQTPRDIRSHCRRLAIEHGRPRLVVVDYLGKLRGTRGTENRVHELGEITGDLKALAVELDAPVVALAQLSRAVEARPDKRPMMSDLRDSGEIEQDADSVLFLYRPEYYYGPTGRDGSSLEGLAELILAKQRNGATGTVSLVFHKEITRFENFSSRADLRIA